MSNLIRLENNIETLGTYTYMVAVVLRRQGGMEWNDIPPWRRGYGARAGALLVTTTGILVVNDNNNDYSTIFRT